MAKKDFIKADLLQYFRITNMWGEVPSTFIGQYDLVSFLYPDRIWGDGGPIRTIDAKERIIYGAANSISERANKAVASLTPSEKLVIKTMDVIEKDMNKSMYEMFEKFKEMREKGEKITEEREKEFVDEWQAKREMGIERFCIMIKDVPNEEIGERVKSVSKKYLDFYNDSDASFDFCMGDAA